jgi:hypothetical protein
MKQGFNAENFTDEQGRPAGGIVTGKGIRIKWQDGPLGKIGSDERQEPNGAFVEDVIEAVIQRIEFYQDNGFYCIENYHAIDHLRVALDCLDERTNRRTKEGTEGTHEGN